MKSARALLLLGCALPLLSCAQLAPLEGWNVLVVLIDSLRARQLGSYGNERALTPTLDRLAEEGIVFDQAYSASSYTRESVAALFTGTLPSRSGAIGWTARPPAERETLASLLYARGYRTALFSNSVMLKDPAFLAGFEQWQFVGDSQMMSGHGPELAEAAAGFLAQASEEPFFLYAHLLDPHGPYAPPDPIRSRIPVPEPEEPIPLYGEVRQRCSELVEEGFGPGDPRFEDLVARYEAELAHTDQAVARILDAVEEAGELDRTLVVVTADHGEEFLEHGFVEHAWTLYEEAIHVPLILWAPEALAPARTDEPASLVDLLATLDGLLGLEADETDGVALLEETDSGWEPVPREEPVIAETLIQTRNMLRSVRDGRWKYISAVRWIDVPERERAVRVKQAGARPKWRPPVDPLGEPVREELYDLARDPGEQRDVSDEHSEPLEALRGVLEAHLEANAIGDPGEATPDVGEEERRQLKALGYL